MKVCKHSCDVTRILILISYRLSGARFDGLVRNMKIWFINRVDNVN